MDLYYELTETGYHIYDRENSLFHVHQYEPHIPYREMTYAENAEQQIHEILHPEDTEATAEDYQEALQEMGVIINED